MTISPSKGPDSAIDIAFRAGVLPDSNYVIRKITDAFAVLVATPELLKDVSPKAISDFKEMPYIVRSGNQEVVESLSAKEKSDLTQWLDANNPFTHQRPVGDHVIERHVTT